MSENDERIESRQEVEAYIQNLRYALDNGAKITIQEERLIDRNRDPRYTNKFTLADLFPEESPVDAVKRELKAITVEDYMKTVRDTKYKNHSEFRQFGEKYNGADVYIKIRVELVSLYGGKSVFIMSFHYAEYEFLEGAFPYKGQ